MYATKSLPPPTTPPPEESDLVGDPGLYWSSDPVDQDHSTREVSSYLARPNPSVSNCGLVIVQVDRRVGDDNHHVPEDHRTYWHPQSLLMPMTQTVGHHLIHHGQTTSLGQDESDDGYRTHSSSSSCSDGNSPQSQLSAESPPPGTTAIPDDLKSGKSCGRQRLVEGTVEEGNNLMWLLDFKLDFFNDEQAKEKERYLTEALTSSNELLVDQHQTQAVVQHSYQLEESVHHQQHHHQQQQIQQQQQHLHHQQQLQQIQQHQQQLQHQQQYQQQQQLHHQPQQSQQQQPQQIETVERVDEVSGDGAKENDDFDKRFRKPPYTYTELITQALKDQQALTVSGIYNWITDRFPYFKAEDDRWKNSVRHNLSMNPHFRKGNKSKQGAGHLWVLADFDDDQEERQPVMNNSTPCIEDEDEAARAVRSILGQSDQKLISDKNNTNLYVSPISMLTPQEDANKENAEKDHNVYDRLPRQDDLSRSTTDYHPKGLKRTHHVEVQYLNDKMEAQDVFVTTDIHNTAGLPPPPKRPSIFVDSNSHITLDNHSNQIVIQTTQSNGVVTYSPMDHIEDLDVVTTYCYEDEVACLEKALGLDLPDTNGSSPNQRELMAK